MVPETLDLGMVLERSYVKTIIPIGDPLGRPAKPADASVSGVSLGDLVGPGVVDQRLVERGASVALGNNDEAIAMAPVTTRPWCF